MEREGTIFIFFYTWTPFFSPYEKINDKSYKTLTRLWMARQNMWNEGVYKENWKNVRLTE